MPEFRRLVMMVNECNADHTKVNALLTVLTAHFAEKKDDRVLVFANIRTTAEVLVERLKERGYRAALFVGKAEGKGEAQLRARLIVKKARGRFVVERYRELVAQGEEDVKEHLEFLNNLMGGSFIVEAAEKKGTRSVAFQGLIALKATFLQEEVAGT